MVHNSIPVTDHLNNQYNSFSDMCKAYNKAYSTVRNRLDRNWTLEQALTINTESQKHKINHKKIWTDHKGNKYNSLPEMCAAYNISPKVVTARLANCKHDIETALTRPVSNIPKNAIQITDYQGNIFKSVSEMCRYHNIKLSRYKERIKLGWSNEKALTTPCKQINSMKAVECKDHLGNIYKSKNEMCKKYNISRYTLRSRLELGWTLEDALTGDYIINSKIIKDYLNREFPTLKDMANFYMLNASDLQGKNHKSFEPIAKMISRRLINKEIGNIKILKCLGFPFFKIYNKTYKSEAIAHVEQILDVYHNTEDFKPINSKTQKNIRIQRCVKFPYYLVIIDDKEYILSYWTIIKINTESNFGLRKKNTVE